MAYQWTLKDGSMRFFKDKELTHFIGGWDTDDRVTGRLFEQDGVTINGVTINPSCSKQEAKDFFKGK